MPKVSQLTPAMLTLLTRRLRVRILFGEPNLSTTSFLRLLVNDRQASTPQNGQYLRNEDTLRGRLGLGYSPRIPPRRWFGSTFSDSPARFELLVNGHQAIRVTTCRGASPSRAARLVNRHPVVCPL